MAGPTRVNLLVISKPGKSSHPPAAACGIYACWPNRFQIGSSRDPAGPALPRPLPHGRSSSLATGMRCCAPGRAVLPVGCQDIEFMLESAGRRSGTGSGKVGRDLSPHSNGEAIELGVHGSKAERWTRYESRGVGWRGSVTKHGCPCKSNHGSARPPLVRNCPCTPLAVGGDSVAGAGFHADRLEWSCQSDLFPVLISMSSAAATILLSIRGQGDVRTGRHPTRLGRWR